MLTTIQALPPSVCSLAVGPTSFAAVQGMALAKPEFPLSVPVPADPVLRGFQVVLQFAASPTDATLGADLSAALRLSLSW